MFLNQHEIGDLFSETMEEVILVRRKQHEDKERILEDWDKSKNLPRKPKKAERKRLIIEY